MSESAFLFYSVGSVVIYVDSLTYVVCSFLIWQISCLQSCSAHVLLEISATNFLLVVSFKAKTLHTLK